MYPTPQNALQSIISITFFDLIEKPELFQSILTNLIKICEIEIQKQEQEKELEKERKLQRKPKKPRTKKVKEEEEVKEEDSIP